MHTDELRPTTEALQALPVDCAEKMGILPLSVSCGGEPAKVAADRDSMVQPKVLEAFLGFPVEVVLTDARTLGRGMVEAYGDVDGIARLATVCDGDSWLRALRRAARRGFRRLRPQANDIVLAEIERLVQEPPAVRMLLIMVLHICKTDESICVKSAERGGRMEFGKPARLYVRVSNHVYRRLWKAVRRMFSPADTDDGNLQGETVASLGTRERAVRMHACVGEGPPPNEFMLNAAGTWQDANRQSPTGPLPSLPSRDSH